ncbi:bifunctional phosphoribosyl-AMP cyclohydrolase/phosphoribosyl-ATP diphosphatase HisIE [Prochlorococcus marinus]|uniref:Histidine biosynthesis bifunctional protein HisIE n=1 Tax=Prochlorococcus marinus XMU1408 TaxID=2213228 RepID=A0A318R3I9_PROMR|nr:bifunctional phosphoribosyl-AMP cyclohydrolase/phosphoribosyl-ATP diphosphatase HisIE [Prochlorococcus marinus]MBW3041604.1 bifunctional phosphoribosyl-AMP cyclohydrolase/phosphoribosyl-ATP diphosphatase [Prochlorococcus marinus str. XMU1408]PYE02760.1 bifunctional phosphoribosyl-AMP cyclohydrolase/phosphoribosyl-ATP diphosphatase [Prochlorococcus marinus XMU1408]
MSLIDNLQFDQNGLIPAIAQDWIDGSILMMAWMNKESLTKTLESGQVHYWSRSRKELWHKGKTSGHFQILKGIMADCDLDTLLLSIEQVGSISCHTGKRSCFFRDLETSQDCPQPPSDACSELFRVIENRKINPEEGSYTNSLLKEGDNKILKKIGEETAEFVMACKDQEPVEIANEAADLVFHLQVALSHQNVSWTEVQKILVKRRGGPRRNQS